MLALVALTAAAHICLLVVLGVVLHALWSVVALWSILKFATLLKRVGNYPLLKA